MNTMILAANTAAYWTNMFETVVIIGGICVALPIVIVWFVVKARTQKMNRKMDIPEKLDMIKDKDVDQIIRWAMKEANPLYPTPVLWGYDELKTFIDSVRE